MTAAQLAERMGLRLTPAGGSEILLLVQYITMHADKAVLYVETRDGDRFMVRIDTMPETQK